MLVALTGAVPAACAAVGFAGSRFTLSWSARLVAPGPVVALVTAGEVALAAWWVVVILWVSLLLCARPLSRAARLFAARWLRLRIEPHYRPDAPLVRMATGFWWNGYEYHRERRSALVQAWLKARRHDRQALRDMLWVLVAPVTVLPVAAAPLLAFGAAAYLVWTPALLVAAAVALVVSLATAPFSWRVLGPLGFRLLGPAPPSAAERRVDELVASQANLTQAQAAELERIERDIHDGAQARLVALGMSIGAAERLVDTDPEGARAMLREARASSSAALDDLRRLVRGINPPVLTERGLVDAVRALALDAPLEVTVRSDVPSRPERPIESAVYFAVAELLANAAKHACATHVTVELGYRAETLTVTVIDDGAGGAVASPGSGLSGIQRRMSAFGGTLAIESPAGGPTLATVVVPCALS